MNKLANETSPYLLQHKDNPVNWFAWGDDAFKHACEEKKLIFLSIGYSTCYWCHVMEKESFEREEVAAVLNEHFICIKVDREERPDVDAIYMDAVVQLVGQGGWPMSVFLTPDLKPFYGGTYFPPDRFIALLQQINGLWQDSREKVLSSADEFTSFLRASSTLSGVDVDEDRSGPSPKEIVDSFMVRFDAEYGGFGGAPKFPPSGPLRLLTLALVSTGGARAAGPTGVTDMVMVQNMAKHIIGRTLDCMAAGGIYDQLGGGFHRYSVDAEWLVPHFEKMLYDNALLVRTYLDAAAALGEKRYLQVAESCLDYVIREMTAPQGGFYSAEDAGEVGREGEFYVWSETELRRTLSPGEFERISGVFEISAEGNFEHGTNVLSLRKSVDWSVRSEPDLQLIIDKLLKVRAARARPFKDDKLITAWNGLMIGAMAVGARLTGRVEYLSAAVAAAEFIKNNLLIEQRLLRTFRAGVARNTGVLDDYAFFIDGLIELYQSSMDEQWLLFARELQRTQDELFWDETNGGFFSTVSTDASLILRKKEFIDNAEPSANALSIGNLSRLSAYFLEPELRERAQKLAALHAPLVARHVHGFSYAVLMGNLFLSNMTELVVSGPRSEVEAAGEQVNTNYNPALVLGYKIEELESLVPLFKDKRSTSGKATYWWCSNGVCEQPNQSFTR